LRPQQSEGGLTPKEGTNFSLLHRHSGLQGDGQPIKAANLDTSDPFYPGLEPEYTPINATTSGRKYRIQIEEYTDPDTGTIYPRIIATLIT
jgi:hypothetical protein